MLDFGRRHVRQTAAAIVALTVVNITIVAMASFKAVEYVDSNAFCGGVCHTVMGPERVAQQRSVHASLACAQCHIGPGAPAFVEAKLGGVRRLQAVVFGPYSRPIPAPVHDLPSAEGTCASCHSPTRLAQAVAATQELYSVNVFRDMNVTWGTYPDNVGHTDAPGCFRCHDDSHTTKSGLVITQVCETCHRSP